MFDVPPPPSPLQLSTLASCVLRLPVLSLSFIGPLPSKLNSDLSFTASATKENFFSLLTSHSALSSWATALRGIHPGDAQRGFDLVGVFKSQSFE